MHLTYTKNKNIIDLFIIHLFIIISYTCIFKNNICSEFHYRIELLHIHIKLLDELDTYYLFFKKTYILQNIINVICMNIVK